MKALTTIAVLTFSSALAIGAASAQGAPQSPQSMKEEKPGLLAQATVTPDDARRLALARVPNGRIREQEIEMENGKLVYSFDMKVPKRRGVEEILIDAKSGALVAQEHEGPVQEKAEASREARKSDGAKRRAAEHKAREEKTKRPRTPR